MILKNAIIIAGGRGTRLNEKTEEIPKPLIKVGGVPLIERILLWLKKNGVENVFIGVDYKKEMIKNYLGNGTAFGMNIIYTENNLESNKKKGTEYAFKPAVEKASELADNFYAMNGDQITDLQLEGLTNAHIKTGAIATMVTINLKTNFGVVEVKNNKVINFQEKGKVSNTLMNSGIYVFNKKIKDYLVDGNIEEKTFKKLAKEGKLYSFFYDGEWVTVNDKKQLDEVEKSLNKNEN